MSCLIFFFPVILVFSSMGLDSTKSFTLASTALFWNRTPSGSPLLVWRVLTDIFLISLLHFLSTHTAEIINTTTTINIAITVDNFTIICKLAFQAEFISLILFNSVFNRLNPIFSTGFNNSGILLNTTSGNSPTIESHNSIQLPKSVSINFLKGFLSTNLFSLIWW